jgi:hypothetical protein
MTQFNVIFSPSKGFWSYDQGWFNALYNADHLPCDIIVQSDFKNTPDAKLISLQCCHHMGKQAFIEHFVGLVLNRLLKKRAHEPYAPLLGEGTRLTDEGQILVSGESEPTNVETSVALIIARLNKEQISRAQLCTWSKSMLSYGVYLDGERDVVLISDEAVCLAEKPPYIPPYEPMYKLRRKNHKKRRNQVA